MDSQNQKDFILWGTLSDLTICDKLLNYYNNAKDKGPGKIGIGVDKNKKDSTDTYLEGSLKEEYLENLQQVCDLYINKFSFCNYYSPWKILEPINIQHYSPNGGYKVWHCERSLPHAPFSQRHLVFMTYLNDVTDGGETEWFYQNLKLAPKKGLTVLWPADWTHTHKGVVSPTQDKYIVTGWYSFYNA